MRGMQLINVHSRCWYLVSGALLAVGSSGSDMPCHKVSTALCLADMADVSLSNSAWH